jgi:hypothetical protein
MFSGSCLLTTNQWSLGTTVHRLGVVPRAPPLRVACAVQPRAVHRSSSPDRFERVRALPRLPVHPPCSPIQGALDGREPVLNPSVHVRPHVEQDQGHAVHCRRSRRQDELDRSGLSEPAGTRDPSRRDHV